METNVENKVIPNEGTINNCEQNNTQNGDLKVHLPNPQGESQNVDLNQENQAQGNVNQAADLNRDHTVQEDTNQNNDLISEAPVQEEKKETTRNNGSLQSSTKDKQRNKRMFGVIMGTLTQFQNQAKNRTNGDIKREEVELKIHEKLQKEKEDMLKQKEEEKLLKIQKQEEQARLKLKREKEIVDKIAEGYQASKVNFLLTQTEPKIFFMPSKHTPVTEKLLNKVRGIDTDVEAKADAALEVEDEMS